MSPLVLWSLVFAGALVVLVYSADWFTDGAEELGLYLGMPAYVVGVTVVAIGTSLPELVSSLFAVAQGSPEIVAGNVVGSNITNIFLVLGFAAVLGTRLSVTYEIIHVDLPMLVASAAFLWLTVRDGIVGAFEGALLAAGAVIYLLYAVNISRQRGRLHDELEEELEEELDVRPGTLDRLVWLRLFGGATLLYFGAEYTVRGVVELSSLLGIGADIIAISAVAFGTSLPELVVSVNAARRGNLEVAIGNVLGSSVFNSFAVLGIPALLAPLPVMSGVLSLGVPVMLVATLLYFFMAQDREMTRWEGWLLILFYVLFLGTLFGVA